MKARDIMTADPHVITQNELVSRAAAIMRDHDIGILPVVDDTTSMRLLGVITDRDIAIRCVAEKHGTSCTAGDHMSADNLKTVNPDDDIDTVMALMGRDQLRRVPVVSEDSRLAGVIAQADLATKLGPNDPQKVEEVLEMISAPNKTLTDPASA